MDSLIEIVSEMADVPAGPKEYHKEGSVLQHTINVIREIERLRPNDPDAFLLAFFHDIGKIRTPKDQLPNHYNHDELGGELIEALPEPILSEESRRKAQIVAEQHMRFKKLPKMKAVKVIRLVENLLAAGVAPTAMLDLIQADAKGREPQRSVDREKFEQCIKLVYDAQGYIEERRVSNDQHRMQQMIEYYNDHQSYG